MTFSPSFRVAVRDRGQLKMLNRPKRDTEGYKMEGSGKQIPFGVEEGAPNGTALVGEMCPPHTHSH